MQVWKAHRHNNIYFYTEIDGTLYKYDKHFAPLPYWQQVLFMKGGVNVALLDVSSPLEFLMVVGLPITTTINRATSRSQFLKQAEEKVSEDQDI
jgi:hypothetical protein